MRPNFFHHLHPPTIPEKQARFRYTLGAGGLGVFLSLVLLVSGALLMFYYVPTPAEAGISVQTITYFVPLGGLVRGLHYWAGQFLLAVMSLHLLRVIFTGAYLPPRRLNYWLGMTLFVSILFLNFTGYVLRWDEGIRWALVTGTNLVKTIPQAGPGLYRFLVGGSEPGAPTLLRFYAWHIFGLTLVVVAVGIWHAFRVRRDGGIAIPPARQRSNSERITRFELVRREVQAMLACGIILLLVAALIPAPLAAPIGERVSLTADAKAPWFFLWVQELLRLGDAFLWGILVPLLLMGILLTIPYLFPRPAPEEQGRWFPKGGRLAQVVTAVIALLILALALIGALRQ